MSRPLENYAGMSVLVVDENPAEVAFLEQVLTRHGMDRVYTATDSRKAHLLLAKHPPDLVLLALGTPRVDGFGLLAEIRRVAAGGYLPVMVLAKDTSTADRNQALVQGAQDFLTKPVDATELVLRIANLLHTRELYATLRYLTAVQTLPGGESAEVKARIQGVLDDKTLTPVFQPIQDLQSREVVGHEGLSRFPDLALGGPGRWFADAYDVGLGIELERLATTAALTYLETAPADRFLTVNMSPAMVMNLAENPLFERDHWPRIVIELTEQVPIEDYPALRRALAPMRENGARLSVDDQGSGYAGFRHLLRLQPDLIKLDMTLVSGINRNHEQQALTRALLAFAYEIGAQVIAEGIEEFAELRTLRDLGVPFGQGYRIGLPAPLAATESATIAGRAKAMSVAV